MHNLRHRFKIAALIMLGCPTAFHFLHFKGKMLTNNYIEPIHKIANHFTEQIIFVLKEEVQCSGCNTRFLANTAKRCSLKAFFHKFFLGAFHKVGLRLAVMYLLFCHCVLPETVNIQFPVNKNAT